MRQRYVNFGLVCVARLRTELDRCFPIAVRGFHISFHRRRISLWLRLSLDLPRDGEFTL